MKFIFKPLLFCMFFTLSTQIHAQEETTEKSTLKNIIRTNPLLLANGELNFRYERSISPRSAIEIRTNYENSDITPRMLTSSIPDDFSTFRIGTAYKFYAFKKENRQQGLYLLGGINYRYSDFTIVNPDNPIMNPTITDTRKFVFSRGTIEVGLGYQFVFDHFLKGLTLDINLSQEYVIPFKNTSFNTANDFETTGAIGIGYSF